MGVSKKNIIKLQVFILKTQKKENAIHDNKRDSKHLQNAGK